MPPVGFVVLGLVMYSVYHVFSGVINVVIRVILAAVSYVIVSQVKVLQFHDLLISQEKKKPARYSVCLIWDFTSLLTVLQYVGLM